jgi:protein-L-isoaspartate(D-aspartate) O-methyltransferase
MHIKSLLGTLLLGMVAACGGGTEPHQVSETAVPPTAESVTTEIQSAPTLSPLPPPSPSPSAVSPSPNPLFTPTETADDPFEARRYAMVESGVIGWGVEDEVVIQAMRTVPRHEFVPEEYLSQAYANHPLPIGFGQTISQPYIVALMTQYAEVKEGDIVLEIGTGSSYQAAVLAEIVEHVYTIEIIGALVERSEETLRRLGYDNVTVRHDDGYYGWEEHAPFDAILVTAAPDHVPQPLVQQLKVGGHLIIPVGPVGGFQTLWQVTRVSEEEVRTKNLGGVTFVPLTRETR